MKQKVTTFRTEIGMTSFATIALGFVAKGLSLKELRDCLDDAERLNRVADKLPNILDSEGANKFSYAIFRCIEFLISTADVSNADKKLLCRYIADNIHSFAIQNYPVETGPVRSKNNAGSPSDNSPGVDDRIGNSAGNGSAGPSEHDSRAEGPKGQPAGGSGEIVTDPQRNSDGDEGRQ